MAGVTPCWAATRSPCWGPTRGAKHKRTDSIHESEPLSESYTWTRPRLSQTGAGSRYNFHTHNAKAAFYIFPKEKYKKLIFQALDLNVQLLGMPMSLPKQCKTNFLYFPKGKYKKQLLHQISKKKKLTNCLKIKL